MPVEVVGATCYYSKMPIYILRPTDPDGPGWIAASRHRGPCRVHAESEEAARQLVAHFFRPKEAHPVPTPGPRPSPWLQPDKTECADESFPLPEEYREGQIEVLRGSGTVRGSGNIVTRGFSSVDPDAGGGGGTWEVVNGGKPPPQPDTSSGDDAAITGHATQRDEAQSLTAAMSGSVLPPLQQRGEGPGVDQGNRAELTLSSIQMHAEGGGVGTRAVTQQTVAHTIQNRAVLTFQATTLADLLTDLVGPEGVTPEQRNMSLGDALGIGDALTEGQLLEVLRSLRDELRRFNDALQQGTTDPAGLERLKETGWKALNTFAQTVAVGSGAMALSR